MHIIAMMLESILIGSCDKCVAVKLKGAISFLLLMISSEFWETPVTYNKILSKKNEYWLTDPLITTMYRSFVKYYH